MKHIKPYNIFENQEEPHQHPGFPNTEGEIHRLCKKYDITNYTINKDLSIDVKGDVYLKKFGLEYLPLNFNYVNGDFRCEYNRLISLKGSPKKISGSFFCFKNKLITLKDGPKEINGYLNCSNNMLITLEYLPRGISFDPIYLTNFIFNPIYKLIYTFMHNKHINVLLYEFNHYRITDGIIVYKDRLEMFCGDFDLDMPNLYEVKKHYTIV